MPDSDPDSDPKAQAVLEGLAGVHRCDECHAEIPAEANKARLCFYCAVDRYIAHFGAVTKHHIEVLAMDSFRTTESFKAADTSAGKRNEH